MLAGLWAHLEVCYGRTASKLFQIVGRIHFLIAIELRPPLLTDYCLYRLSSEPSGHASAQSHSMSLPGGLPQHRCLLVSLQSQPETYIEQPSHGSDVPWSLPYSIGYMQITSLICMQRWRSDTKPWAPANHRGSLTSVTASCHTHMCLLVSLKMKLQDFISMFCF